MINLLVIYADKMESLRDELSAFDLIFEKHHHGKGPVHYACEQDGLCLEIYPSSDTNPKTHTRIGLSVSDMAVALDAAKSIQADIKVSPKDSPWGIRAVIQLATGLKVELVQPN